MDIVILANFCGDFSEKDNGRFLYLAKLLAENHNVELITSDFFHIKKKTHKTPYVFFSSSLNYVGNEHSVSRND